MRTLTVVGFVLAWLVVVGCQKKGFSALGVAPASVHLKSSTECDPQKSGSVCNDPAAAIAASTIVSIIFVGKEQACECTRKRIDVAWLALQKAIGTPPTLPVERVQIDTEGDTVEPYKRQKPMVTVPAVYFVDAKGTVIELLQGELTVEQITDVLGTTAKSR